MILTVTANAAVDRTLRVGSLVPGGRHTVLRDHAQAGGKGVNVARALGRLGVRARTVVVVAGETGAWIVADLQRGGLAPEPILAAGSSRTCLEIAEETGRVTQLHGPGPRAGSDVARRLVRVALRSLEEARWLALCGSLAPGLPEDTYAELVRAARGRDVSIAVDASGAALRSAWHAGPDLVRVNRDEANDALGRELRPGDPLPPGPARTAPWCIVSDGPGPVWMYERGEPRWRARPPPIRLRNPIGCGDAMLAGVLAARCAGSPWPEALRAGVALAAADAESEVAGRPDPRRARELLPEVRLDGVAGTA